MNIRDAVKKLNNLEGTISVYEFILHQLIHRFMESDVDGITKIVFGSVLVDSSTVDEVTCVIEALLENAREELVELEKATISIIKEPNNVGKEEKRPKRK